MERLQQRVPIHLDRSIYLPDYFSTPWKRGRAYMALVRETGPSCSR